MTTEKAVLLLIDIQLDFLPGGALAVEKGDQIIAPILDLATKFPNRIATQDWHPAGHKSFASSHSGKNPYDQIDYHGFSQTLWPDHCVQHTHGAEIHPTILGLGLHQIIQKGTNPEVDSYSAFFDNHRLEKTRLQSVLQKDGIETLIVAGLATDYCVLFTVLDALEFGYQVVVFEPGVRGVNLNPKDSALALEKMRFNGAAILQEI